MKIESHLLRFTLAVLIITVVIEFFYELITEADKAMSIINSIIIWLLFWFFSALMIAIVIFFVFIKLSHKTEAQNKSYKRIINRDDIYLASVLIISTFAIRKVSEVFGGIFKEQIWFYIAVFLAVFPIWFIVNLFYSRFIDLFQIPPYH